MKKTTKTVKTPAPAPKPAAPAAVKKAAAPAAPKKTVKKAVVAAAAAVPAPAPVKKAPAPVVPVKPKTVETTITAAIDVGFGNTLFVRGVGPGLSWEKGVALTNAGEASWTISLPESARPVTFKFLLNDEVWSLGEDYTVESGSTTTFTPSF